MTLELLLDEREPERVVVSVCLAPGSEPHPIDGVAVELFDPDDQSLGPRLLLPISGTLGGPLVTQAELRRADPIPRNSTIVATVWWGSEQLQATCPVEHGTNLCHHVRPRHTENPNRPQAFIEPLLAEDRAPLTRAFPWLDTRQDALRRPHLPISVVPTSPTKDEDPLDEVADELGLDDENAEWLRELLDEEDE